MEYARLGTSGLYVSKIILGCASFGDRRWQDWVLEEEEALPLLAHAFQRGINTWDTADAYSNGRSEEIVGAALRKYNIPREQVVIMTKIFYALDPEEQTPIAANANKKEQHLVNRVGLSRKKVLSAVAESCARLGTYIDVLQIHRLDRDCDPEEIMWALNDVVQSGQVRYLGACSMPAWEFQKLQYIAERNKWHRFISMHNYYNILYREEEREMIPLCRDLGVGIIPWSPLARGDLAHPWDDNSKGVGVQDTKSIRSVGTDKILQSKARAEARDNMIDKEVVRRVANVAERRGVKMATVGLSWCLHKGVYPVTGLGYKDRVDQAVEAIEFQLTDEEVQYIDELYEPKKVMY